MNIAARRLSGALVLALAAACQGVAVESPSIPPPTATSAAIATTAPTIPLSTFVPSALPSALPTPSPLPSPTPSPTPPATASPSAQLSPTPTPSPTPEPTGLVVNWRNRGEVPGFGRLFDDSSTPTLHSATVFAGRYFVVGAQEDADYNKVPALWSSSDGFHWALAGVPDLFEAYAMAANRNGLVIAGESVAVGTGLWLSTNGSDWDPVEFTDLDEQWMFRVSATRQGFVGFGSGAWTSTDGRNWQTLATESALALLAAGVVEMAAYGDRIVALTWGSTGRTLVVWTSTNLVDWTRVGPLRGSRSLHDQTLAGGPLGWIVAGYEEDRVHKDFMWWSADGLTWQQVTPAIGPVSDVLIDDAGYVAVGFQHIGTGCALDPSDIQGHTWTSLDGRVWTEMSQAGFLHQRIDQLLRDGRTLYGIGLAYEEDSEAAFGSVWTARLPAIPPAVPGPVAQIPEPDPGGCGPG